MNYSNYTNKRTSSSEDESNDSKNTLGFFLNTIQVTHVQVPIDEPVQEPKYYRDVVNMLQKASEHDTVEFIINTPGGDVMGFNSLAFGLEATQATTLATLVGACHSAGSLLALSCDVVQVADNATMLCHAASWGSYGKSSDVTSHVLHIQKHTEAIMRKCYHNFLTTEEQDALLAGKDFWFDATEIRARLQRRDELNQAEESEEPTEKVQIVETKPSKVKSKKE